MTITQPAIAIDVGATNTRVALVSPRGEILKKTVSRTQGEGSDPLVVARDVIDRIQRLVSADELRSISGIGISTAGPVDMAAGAIVHPPNMPFSTVPLVQPLKEHFRLPVRLINDARAGVLAEVHFGAAVGIENVVYITISTGLGGGAYVNGRLLLGSEGNAGEIGHFLVDNRYNLRCGCGLYGHWEAYASGKNMPAFFRAWRAQEGLQATDGSPEKAEEIFAAAGRGDSGTLRFLEELGRMNGRGLSNVIVAYNPEVVVLDGPVVQNNPDFIIPYMERYVDRYLRMPEIRRSPLEGEAPLLGAAVVAGRDPIRE